MKNVLVLGDSFATPLGTNKGNFVDAFIENSRYDDKLHFLNPSTFNVTSADALEFFRKAVSLYDLKLVVVALGNCDSCGFGFIKRRFPFGGSQLSAWYDKKIKKSNPLLLRNRPYQFANLPVFKEIKSCVNSGQFTKNIKTIAKLAEKSNIPVVFLHIKGNETFPPCNNIGNFTYYKVFGLKTKLPYVADQDSQSLIDALSSHDQGRYEDAKQLYQTIVTTHTNTELEHIARNNLGAIHYDEGNVSAACAELEKIPSTTAMFPLILYNKALASNDDQLLQEAFQQDRGTYRVSAQQKERALSELSDHQNVTLIDLTSTMPDSEFVDYCHPEKLVHRKIYQELEPTIRSILSLKNGTFSPTTNYLPWNPDRAVGFENDFFNHFLLTVTPDNNFVSKVIQRAKTDYQTQLVALESPSRSTKAHSIAIISAHPLFGSLSFLNQIHPKERVDQGRLPELFFLRHMMPLYDRVELNIPWVPNTTKVEQWIENLNLRSRILDLEKANSISQGIDWDNVLKRCQMLLLHTLAKEPVLFNKLRTITYWFFREAMVFGPHSEPSMLYDRLSILKAVDSIIFFQATQRKEHSSWTQYEELLQQIYRVVAIHEKYLQNVRAPFKVDQDLLNSYRHELHEIEITIAPNIVVDPDSETTNQNTKVSSKTLRPESSSEELSSN